MDLNNLNLEIKSFIIKRLDLELSPSDIDDEQPLFGEVEGSLALDSVDALELVVGIRSDFGIEVDEDVDPTNFMTVKAIADFIRININTLQPTREETSVS